jgi:UDP-glucuronate 4-epimerase
MSLQNTILVTGSAGFIGFALSKKLLEKGIPVVGVDSLNSYYDVQLKLARNAELKKYSHYSFEHLNLCDLESVKSVFKKYQVSRVCHLAALDHAGAAVGPDRSLQPVQ